MSQEPLSGVPDPGSPPEAGPILTPQPEEPPATSGVEFLVLVVVAGLCFFGLLRRPSMDAIAALLRATGIPAQGPGAYPSGGWAEATMNQPSARFVQVVGPASLVLLFAISGALLLRGGFRRRLGLVRPRGGWSVLALAGALEVLIFVFGVATVTTFLPPGFESPEGSVALARSLHDAPFGWWVALVIAMSVLPGVGEEAMFRGLIQRRLLESWRPSVAILCTGLIFTLLHPPFVRALMLLPACLWLGYLAWRCGSILPGIVLHIGTNAGVQVMGRFLEADDTGPEPGRWWALLTALASGALSVWLLVLLHRRTRVPGGPRDQVASS